MYKETNKKKKENVLITTDLLYSFAFASVIAKKAPANALPTATTAEDHPAVLLPPPLLQPPPPPSLPLPVLHQPSLLTTALLALPLGELPIRPAPNPAAKEYSLASTQRPGSAANRASNHPCNPSNGASCTTICSPSSGVAVNVGVALIAASPSTSKTTSCIFALLIPGSQ